ncbi:uncharacterized protein [Misgurnus anguillicaudatus]|uniref:uncharacterized protein n=1 Tax=Misgurnus anguillicaudatus TaxID=75329 RepID=UPI003CCFC06D
MEGDSVILHTDIKLQTDDLVLWKFGSQETLIARINSATSVFGDKVKSVSVIEGHSVTLHTHIKLQTDDLIVWKFGPEKSPIARINVVAKDMSVYDVLDVRFRDRLQMNDQTGDLTITNITTNHTGLYHMIFSGKQIISSHRFNVTVYDELKAMLVKQGASVTLHTHLTEIQKNDVIEWSFGPQGSLIARINGATSEVSINDDVLDGRFRDRLQVNDQTGDLTITDTKTKDSGLYQMSINTTKECLYNVTVYGE